MLDAIVRLIAETVGMSAVTVNEPMSKHTTFKIGGPADVMVEPGSAQQLLAVLKLIKKFEIPYFVMGNGSNLLVGDKGIRGAVIKISGAMSDCDVDGNYVRAQSGIKLSRLAHTALNNGLKGLEFASGIPGTLGGAVFMNAGAYGEEMKDVISEVTYIDTEKCELITIPGDECEFGYRKSIFTEKSAIVTEAVMKLENGNVEEIKEKMNDLAGRRCDKQPLDKPSAGSTFKRPEGYFAGALIQDCGLKGCSVGGAQVSEKHSGFVINTGNATAEDVAGLIKKVQADVRDKFGVDLETEVRFVGEF